MGVTEQAAAMLIASADAVIAEAESRRPQPLQAQVARSTQGEFQRVSERIGILFDKYDDIEDQCEQTDAVIAEADQLKEVMGMLVMVNRELNTMPCRSFSTRL